MNISAESRVSRRAIPAAGTLVRASGGDGVFKEQWCWYLIEKRKNETEQEGRARREKKGQENANDELRYIT